LPELLKSILAMLPDIIDTVIDMLPDLIKAGFELFSGLISGLLNALPDIIDAVIDMIPEITGALMDNIPKLIAAGMEIVKGLAKGIIDNAPRLLGEAIGSLGKTLVNGVKDFLGIRSPSKVFIDIGNEVGNGFVKGITDTQGAVESAAGALGDITKAAMADIRKLAEETEGLFSVFSKNDKLVKSYTGFGIETLVNKVGGGQFDVGKLTDSLNSLERAGYNNVAEAAFGGSVQQTLDKLMGQQTYVNATTGMQTAVSGNLSDEALARVLGPGFVALPKLDKSVEQLTDAIDSLNSQVASKGLTPFASGGLVTGPTAALIGEAGPEVVIPLNRFESMMGMTGNKEGKSVNYYAAPNNSIDSEQALFQAMRRAKVVAGW
jgi:hypothetical protein